MFGKYQPPGTGAPLVVERFIAMDLYGKNWDPKKTATEQKLFAAHIAYFNKLIAQGKVLLAGPWGNFEMAWIVFSDKVTTWEEAQELVDGDPWAKAQITNAVVQQWITNPLAS